MMEQSLQETLLPLGVAHLQRNLARGWGVVNDGKAVVAMVAAAVKEGLPSEVDPYPGIP